MVTEKLDWNEVLEKNPSIDPERLQEARRLLEYLASLGLKEQAGYRLIGPYETEMFKPAGARQVPAQGQPSLRLTQTWEAARETSHRQA